MPIVALTDLHQEVATWFEQNITQSRLNQGDKNRQWSVDALSFTDNLTQAAMRAFVDRSQLNASFIQQYISGDINDKKDLSMIKIEIAMLYSFLKCFVERHKVRLTYYRDDLSQKGARNMYNVKLSEEVFTQIKQELSS